MLDNPAQHRSLSVFWQFTALSIGVFLVIGFFLTSLIDETKNILAFHIVSLLALLFVTIAFIAWHAARKLDKQQRTLQGHNAELEKMVRERTLQLEESTQECLRQAEEFSRLKDEFVSLAAHQLRTPPSIVSWYTETLLTGDLGPINEKQKEYLDEIYNANKRTVQLVNDFLTISRIELGTFSITREPVDIQKLTETILKEFAPKILVKRMVVETSFAPDIPIISADPKVIRIVLDNLVSNALKYTRTGGTIRIMVTPQPLPDEAGGPSITITVADNGYGIPQDQQKKIFTKLFRANDVRTTETEGMGLGLYLVKGVIEQSGGTITFTSQENQGTTFTVTFPVEMK